MATSFVCDVCGFQSDDCEVVDTHLRDSHQITDPCEVGSINQSDGMLTLRNGDEVTVINLADWLQAMLVEAERDKPKV